MRAMRIKGTLKTSFCCLFSSYFLILAIKVVMSEDSGLFLRSIFDIQEEKANKFLFTYNGNYAYVHIKTTWSSLNPYQWLLFIKGMDMIIIFKHLLLQYQFCLASVHASLLLI